MCGFKVWPMPPMTIEKVGYGAGKRQTGRFNALRCIWEMLKKKKKLMMKFVCLRQIDDMNPEILGYVMNRLLRTVHWMYSIRPFT